MSGAISNYIRTYNNIMNDNIRKAKNMSDNFMNNNITGDNFVSANIIDNTSLKVIRHYFDYSSMTCCYSHDKLIIQCDNRGELRINISLINDELHIANYKQAILENFSKALSSYNLLYNLKSDVVKFDYMSIYDPALAEQLYKAVTITLYNDAKLQRWAKFDLQYC